MPTTYAHYRFGCDVLAAMPTDLREIVEKHRQLFDFGVHGPDLLFYDKPFPPLGSTPLAMPATSAPARTFLPRR